MKASQVLRALSFSYATKRPVFLQGPPGVGKTEVVRRFCKDANLRLIDLRLSLMEPVDLRGLPEVTDGETTWARPTLLPIDGKGIIFLDEITQALPSMQTVAMQLTRERRIGEHEIGKDWGIVLAGNRLSDRAGVQKMITPLRNRITHIEFDVDHDEWQTYATENGLHPGVRGFMRLKPEMLCKFPEHATADNEPAFPTPRSWETASDILTHADRSLWQDLLNGTIGQGAGSELMNYINLIDKLPDIRQLLAKPDTSEIPSEPSLVYAVCGAIANVCKSDIKMVDAAYTYARRMRPEYGVIVSMDINSLGQEYRKHPATQKWIVDMKKAGVFG